MENQYKPIAQHWELAEADGIIEGNTRSSKVTDSIIQLFKTRDELGFKKFGVALEDSTRNNLDDRLTDIIEELCDALQYLVSLQGIMESRKNNE
tara:strand:- start:154 stop:435 length:282 start_codon:yes stop_codon:yes gene_type:complete